MKAFMIGAAVLSSLAFASGASAEIVKRVYQCIPEDPAIEASYTIECESELTAEREPDCGCEKGFHIVSVGESFISSGLLDEPVIDDEDGDGDDGGGPVNATDS